VAESFFDYSFPSNKMEKSPIRMIEDVGVPLSLVRILVEANGEHVIYVARYGLQVIEFVGLLELLGLLE